MKRICNQCQAEMKEDCSIKSDGDIGNIIKKSNSLFNSIKAIPKVAI
jgi:hypothetical protein